MKSLIVATAALAAVFTGAAPATAAIGDPVVDGSGAIFRPDEWTKGDVGFNQQGYYTGVPPYQYLYFATYAMSGVHAPKQVPKAGEVFYLHAWAGLTWPFYDSDNAVIRLGLPEGVSVAPSSRAPVKCYITQADYKPSREGGCLSFPSGATGASIYLGSYVLTSGIDGGSESIDIFVPVIADRAVNGDKAWVSTQMLQTPGVLPNPLYGDAPLTVAPGSGPGGGTSAGLVAPSSQSVRWKGKGKAVVSWPEVSGATSYRARLKVGKKWTKWTPLASNALKLTKLKKGKRYVLQVQAVGDGGRGPVATWRFKAKK
jgi:hypothetical protein